MIGDAYVATVLQIDAMPDDDVMDEMNKLKDHVEAPVLTAVPGAQSNDRSLEDLASTVLETMDLAKIRGVNPVLRKMSPFLPALYFIDFKKPSRGWEKGVDPAPHFEISDSVPPS